MAGKVLQLGGGRPRKPTAAKELAGTLRKSRANPTEPRLSHVEIPGPPSDANPHQQRAWVELKALIDPMRVTTASDLFAFRRMAWVAAHLVALEQSLQDSGGDPVYVEQTKAGPQLRTRPEVLAIPTYEKLLMLHMAQWGISPANRSKVSALSADKPKNDPFAKFKVGAPK